MAESLERSEELSSAGEYFERMRLTSVTAFSFQGGLAAKKYGIHEAITAVFTKEQSEAAILNFKVGAHRRLQTAP